MAKSICILNGHPDPSPERLIHALTAAYADGALEAGHTVERIDVGRLDYGYLETAEDYGTPPSADIQAEREKIAAADHVVIAFPLWLGGMPAKLRGFLEHAARADFFLKPGGEAEWPVKMMAGKSARVILTMGMPSLMYRFAMDAGSLKALERGILGLAGFKPVRHTTFGGVGQADVKTRGAWLEKVTKLGRDAE